MPDVSCYSMDLYCDHANEQHEYREFPWSYTGRTHAGCKRQAQKHGWRWHANGMVACPKCKNKRQPSQSAAWPG